MHREGDRDDTFWVHSFDQEICAYVCITLCTPEKGRFSPSLCLLLQQGNTPFSLFLLSILSVSLLHSSVTSRPSYLARKGEELWIKKTQTFTTVIVIRWVNIKKLLYQYILKMNIVKYFMNKIIRLL